jgi:hypothetical protein
VHWEQVQSLRAQDKEEGHDYRFKDEAAVLAVSKNEYETMPAAIEKRGAHLLPKQCLR